MYIFKKETNFLSFMGVAQKNARQALLKFWIVFAGNPFWVKLEAPKLVESWILISTTIGENLVSISQTTFEKFKFNQILSLPLDNQSYILYLWISKMYHWFLQWTINLGWFWITQKWFEILTPKFHQLMYPWVFNFPPNLLSLAWLKMDFLPKLYKL